MLIADASLNFFKIMYYISNYIPKYMKVGLRTAHTPKIIFYYY